MSRDVISRIARAFVPENGDDGLDWRLLRVIGLGTLAGTGVGAVLGNGTLGAAISFPLSVLAAMVCAAFMRHRESGD